MGGEARDVRDRLLDDSLTRLASEAAIRLSTLVAGGDQIPFDVDAGVATTPSSTATDR